MLLESTQTQPRSQSLAELCELAASGLVEMLDPERQMFCEIYRRTDEGMRRWGLSPRYTLMTLLGLHRYEQSGGRSTLATAPLLETLLKNTVWIQSTGDLGLLLWTCAELAPERLPEVYERISAQDALTRFIDGQQGSTMEVAWYLTGLASCLLAGHVALPGLDEAVAKARLILENNCGASGVYGHLSHARSITGRLRRRIGTFADQVYPTIAFALLSRAHQDETARAMALRTAETMCTLQGAHGEWYWHFDSVSGKVVSRYPVYSVHQHGMGPMMLFAVEESTGRRFSQAIHKSLSWIGGNNDLDRNLVDPSLGLVWRAIYLNSFRAFTDSSLRFLKMRHRNVDVRRLKIRYECRPYELGWLLYALASRSAEIECAVVPNLQGASRSANTSAKVGTRNDAYVLITAAHNEEKFIEGTIRSVLAQSVRPSRWVIVSDGSTDRTNEIVAGYANENAFIQLLRVDQPHKHDFGAKAHAIRAGYELLKDEQYDFIGILDADISLEPDNYRTMLNEFGADSKLGVAGGFIHEEKDGVFTSRVTNRTWSVAGAMQFFRRECFEGIGGIPLLKYGGEDWCADLNASMRGWTTKAIPQLPVFHHRPTCGGTDPVRARYQQGKMAYSLGYLPIFEALRAITRLAEKPVVIGVFARLAGFASSYCLGEDRPVSKEFVQFLRKEQRRRLFSISR